MIPEPLQFNANDLNNALLKDPALKLDMQAEKSAPNQLGIYHDTYRPKETKRRNHCYYLCDPDGNDHVNTSSSLGKAWFTTIPDMMDDIQALERATHNKERRHFPPAAQFKRQNKEGDGTAAKRLCQDSTPTSSSHTEQAPACSSTSNRDEETTITIKMKDESDDIQPQLPPGCNIWWQSTEAFKLSMPRKIRRLLLTDVRT